MEFDDIVDKLAKKVQATDEGYAINHAEVREFLDQYPDYCEDIEKKKELNLPWIITLIKGEN